MPACPSSKKTLFALSPTLEAMGMKRAFSRAADFSGISSVESLYISAVLHKAYVDVNEEGSLISRAHCPPSVNKVIHTACKKSCVRLGK